MEIKFVSLYSFQDGLEKQIVRALADRRRVMLQAPTGSGKTHIAMRIARANIAAGCRVWFMAHRIELLDQASATFAEAGLSHGLIRGGKSNATDDLLQVCSVQSMGARVKKYPAPDLIIWDEAHHIAAATWVRLMKRFPNARHLGLSATPERLDGKPLGEWFDHLLVGPSTAELETLGVLAPCRIFAPTIPDLKGFHVEHFDYKRSEVDVAMSDKVLIGDALDHYRRIAGGRSAIVFAVSVVASKAIAAKFNAAGVSAVHVDATTPREDRAAALAGLRSGSIKVVSSVEIFTEGLDVPAIGAVILLRPTKSLALYLQMIGRGRRVHGDYPNLIVLDHSGLFYDHGSPNDERTWSLGERRAKRNRAVESQRMRLCPECSAVHEFAGVCPECGHVYGGGDRSIAEVFGELHEVAIPEGCETIAQFAQRIRLQRPTIWNLFKRGMPRHSEGLIVVAEALAWYEADLMRRKSDLSSRMRKQLTDPAFAARRKSAHKKYWSNPATKAKHGERTRVRTKRLWANPDHREKVINSQLATNRKPETRARRSAASKEVSSRKGMQELKSKKMTAFYKDHPEAKVLKSRKNIAFYEARPEERAKRAAETTAARAKRKKLEKQKPTD